MGAALESGMRQLHPRGVGACGALDEQGPFSLRECLPLLAQAPFPLRVTQGRQARPLPLAEEHVCTVNKEVARECACAEWGKNGGGWRWYGVLGFGVRGWRGRSSHRDSSS